MHVCYTNLQLYVHYAYAPFRLLLSLFAPWEIVRAFLFFFFFLFLWGFNVLFFQNKLFRKNLLGMPFECQTDWI